MLSPKLPLFFCITLILLHSLDIVSTHIGLNMGFYETDPLWGLPLIIVKYLLALAYYVIPIFAEKLLPHATFKWYIAVYVLLYAVMILSYSVTLINNFNLILSGDRYE